MIHCNFYGNEDWWKNYNNKNRYTEGKYLNKYSGCLSKNNYGKKKD